MTILDGGRPVVIEDAPRKNRLSPLPARTRRPASATADRTATRHAAGPAPAPPDSKKSDRRRVSGVFSSVVTGVAILLALVAVVLAVASHESAPGVYETFGHPMMSVVSGSMTPAIRTGDLVVDDPVSASEAARIKVGQIISFRSGSKIFTHRIHAVEEVNGTVAYQTKGDANDAPDLPLVSPSQVVGVYAFKIPDGGYVLNALHKPMVLALLLACPVLWLLAVWLFGLAQEADRPHQGPVVSEEGGAAL